MSPATPELDLRRWRELHAVVAQWLELDESELRSIARAVSGWSPLEHLAHLTLANELCLRNLQCLARREGLLVQKDRRPNEQVAAVLASGSLPRGQAQAPRMVVPPVELELSTVRGWHGDNLDALGALERSTSAFEPTGLTIPHQILGSLDAPGWLRFAVVHTRHHLLIASDVRQATGAKIPATLPAL